MAIKMTRLNKYKSFICMFLRVLKELTETSKKIDIRMLTMNPPKKSSECRMGSVK